MNKDPVTEEKELLREVERWWSLVRVSLWIGTGTRYGRAVRPTESFVKLEHIRK